MDALTLGFALGVGATLVLKRGRGALRSAVGWSARQVGSVTARVSATIDAAKSTVRSEYERGREANLEDMTELPPPSAHPAEETPKSIPPPIIVAASPRKNGRVTQRAS